MRSLLLASLLVVAALAGRDATAVAQAPAVSLDYETFKTKVQPILLAKVDGYARCYVCHSQGTGFRLQRLSEGATAWNEDQSKLNFQAVQKVITPGDPFKSRLLLMPLSHDAGGTEFHPGGKRWDSRTNREWRAIADWIGAK
jgi:hypothetical protein